METENERRDFFETFFREFHLSLRGKDMRIMDSLIEDLVSISYDIPPYDKTYSFREILMLIALINQKRLKDISD